MNKNFGIKSNGEPYKILVVDDLVLVHKMVEDTLSHYGFQIVATAKNGKKGVELFSKHKPDLVTMDITMPIMDGIEASKEILKIDPQASILMLSSMADEDIREEAKEIGVSHFIQKPFDSELLLYQVMKTLKI